MKGTAASAWDRLNNNRSALLTRWQNMARYTIPRVCRESSYDDKTDITQFDWQSVGAQAVNNVVNKMMMALFAPSRPFMRLTPSTKAMVELSESGIDPASIEEALADAEQDAVRELDRKTDLRPKLHLAMLNLAVLGSTCVYLPDSKDDNMKVYYSRNWVVRRAGNQAVAEIVIREKYQFADLQPDIQEALKDKHYKPDTEVLLYKWITRNDKHGYELTQWVDTNQLPEKYSGAYKDADALPYKVWSWSLTDGADYGTGLVEDYYGDFSALSALSEAMVKGAILSSEFRWLVNPAGQTKPNDLMDSQNGAALPGTKDDVHLLESSKRGDLATVQGIAADIIRRIGIGFLMGSAVTRDAERVTAEEIRQQAAELESSLGGVYSRAAVEIQLPLATWLLRNIGIKVGDKLIEVSIVTGLDALSRTGDLDALRAALSDIAMLKQVEMVADELNTGEIITAIFIGHGLSPRKYALSSEEVQANRQAKQQESIVAAAGEAGAVAGATAAVEGM